ncbi:MAG: 2,3-bisphosphoglycerate-independent phosphoglycerate mutase [Candidatus Micrarchaeota archaeon]|nr:2,3-bisphosphoglycerate-independent phosphoglycerate mutase [Candidatus Micrarchaeota archaeon]
MVGSMKKVILIIRDGWGHGPHYEGNAIWKAKTPNHDYYKEHFPTTVLQCTGNAVGNPEGVQGGSEVGHLTIGAGRIVWQPYELINREIREGTFFKNEILIDAIEHAKKNGTDIHVSGLFSDQGVHADYRHMIAFLKLCRQQSFDRVFIHLILDGRDMPEKSALPLISDLEHAIEEIKVGKIATVIGRYYAMDRDKNWDRTLKAYNLWVLGDGFSAESAQEAVRAAYERGDKTDYYVQPTVITDKSANPLGLLKENDAFVFYNFRSDRARQITAMIAGLSYCPEKPENFVPNVHYTCFCRYDPMWTLPVAFPQHKVINNLGQVISENRLKQLRIAETEKYAHVTFFFNSQDDEPYENEERVMVPSPKVPSYDEKPEMSAYEVTEKLLQRIGEYEFILVNYANPDLVGHSGVFDAVVKACEVVDECVGKVVKKALENDYVIFLMADHGNADHMLHEDGSIDPSHGFAPVLLTIISNDEKLKSAKLKEGKGLKDVAPTILNIMGLPKPEDMNGEVLINSS